ncbi:MAG: hypothetical protein ACUVQZ_03020 [Candidatus Caldatribacteriaceae bacterium]
MNIIFKALLYWGFYGILHFGYTLSKIPILKPICGTSESVFEHLKIGFFAYLLASLCEYILYSRRYQKLSFFATRFFSTLSIPWIIFLLWYLGVALWGKVEILYLELAFANGVVLVSGMMGKIIEKEIEQIHLSSQFQSIVYILFGITLFIFVRFTYAIPWIDVFALP